MSVVIIVLLVIIAVLLFAGAVIGLAFNLLWFVLTGVVIGALGRLVLPGKQAISLLATALIGIAASLLGGILGDLFDVGGFAPVPGRDRARGARDRALRRQRAAHRLARVHVV